jgi:hypothetical protein
MSIRPGRSTNAVSSICLRRQSQKEGVGFGKVRVVGDYINMGGALTKSQEDPNHDPP